MEYYLYGILLFGNKMNFFSKIKQNEFLKAVSVLMTGTVLAQAIGYFLAPVITRLFTPEEMGEFGMFQRIVVLIATISTARYEFSLPLPKKDGHAFLLYRFAIKICFIVIAITVFLSLIFGFAYSKSIDFYLVLLGFALAVFSLVLYNLGNNWAIRKEEFAKISFAKMTNSISLNGSRVLFGVFGYGSFGLIASFIISLFVAASHFSKDLFFNTFRFKPFFSKKKQWAIAKKHKDFPLANLPHALSDNLRDVFVALLIIECFSESVFGSFDHSFRMLRIPIMIVGTSMSQVFFNRISNLTKEGKKLFPLFKKIIIILFLVSIIPFAIIFFFGGPLFSFIFGSEWHQSGLLSEIMVPWLMLNFMVSPLSTAPLVLGKQRSYFIVGLTASLLQLSGFFFLPMLLGTNQEGLFWVFKIVSWSQALFSIFILYYLYRIIKNHDINV